MYRIDNATAAASLPAASDPGPNPDSYYTEGNPGTGVPATVVPAEHLNMIQEEIARAIEAAGITLDKGTRNQLARAMPADVAFMAGWGGNGAGEDAEVQVYGAVVLARNILIMGERSYAEVSPTGADMIFDIKKNGVSIYSTKPEIADGDNAGTAGVLTTPTGVQASTGDRLTFEITQVGSTAAGQKVMFTLKAGCI